MVDKKKLYDSPASKKARGEKTAYLGADKEPAERQNKEKPAGEPKKDKPAGEAEEPAGAKAEGKAAEKPKDSRSAALEAIHARHRTERRDSHGNYRSELDKMASRHAKELDEAYVAGAATELEMTDGGVSKEVAAAPAAEAEA